MNQYRKALKNYSVGRSAKLIVSDINEVLLDFGAKGIGFEYGDLGKVSSIYFKIEVGEQTRFVTVPCEWQKTEEVLRKQGQSRYVKNAYLVALANVLSWLDAQLAMLTTRMVEFDQIFLPYMADPVTGKTFYQVAKDNNFMTISGG